METLHYEHIDETIYKTVLANGLTVFLLPKQEVHKTYSIFMTNYGSMDRTFTPLNEQEVITVPDGIAHFLEHKLFEKEDYDVFSTFLEQSASPNAYTSFTKTAYLFSTTEKVAENVETLLDFVQRPYFSVASVEKEKGIIAEEIKMYDDEPNWQSFMGTVKNMFSEIPINIDIAGTVESINKITHEDLYTCYNTFYHPKNMALFVIGNFADKQLINLITENQDQKEFPQFTVPERKLPDEPKAVHVKDSVIHLPVNIPKVTIGIKESSERLNSEQLMHRDVMQSIMLDYFFSSSGLFYEELYQEELIDQSFEYSSTVEAEYGFSLISSNTTNPEKLISKLKELLLGTKTLQIDEQRFEILKKKLIGELLKSMDSLEGIANNYLSYHFAEVDYFQLTPYIQKLTVEDAQQFMESWIDEERLTSCTIINQTSENNG